MVSYLLGLNAEKVLPGPRSSGDAGSQGLADGHEHGQGRSCLASEEGSVFRTPRSSCATHTMQKCKQGWPLPPLTLLFEQPVSMRQDCAFAASAWGFPQREECCAGAELEQPPAVPGSGCSRGAADSCSIRGTGSSPGTAPRAGCCGRRLGPLPPLRCPAPIPLCSVLLMYRSRRARPGPSLSFHFYTTAYKRSDAFIAKQQLEQKAQETQYSGKACGI